jgi:ABC-type multidrug transport system ATPase subunit
MANLGFPEDWILRPILAELAFIVFFTILNITGLSLFKVEMTVARSVSRPDLSVGKQKMTSQAISESCTLDVGLEKFALTLHRRSALGKQLPTKTILNPITATFQSGSLNVIMGPSGSGKTSLLNAIALRLRNSAGTRYESNGVLTLNGSVPSDIVIRSVCSYVCQDDDTLLPSLTVRETLRFAARLRLPSWMNEEEKFKRAEDILLKMGLKDCADTLVGNDMIKGISGGEKRRVSIATQILTEPRVLLLDEPTSGLDAFTTSSIMEVLQGLAREGRTVIMTIHQARSNLFQTFGNILLLTRGGSPAYAGSAKNLVSYFASLGYNCPQHTNPGDYALDLVTVDLQQESNEMESRKKADYLLAAWAEQVRLSELEAQRVHHSPSPDVQGEGGYTRSQQALLEAEGKSDETCSGESDKGKASDTGVGVDSRTPVRRRSTMTTITSPAELGALLRKPTPFLAAIPILIQRATINFCRQPELLIARTMQVLGLALVLTLFTAPLHDDYFSVQNRVGFIQNISAFYFVGILQNVAVYPIERDVFYREQDDGVYGVGAFLFAYTVLELPFEIVSSLMYGLLAVFAVGLPRTAPSYFTSALACLGIVSCGESLGIMLNTVFARNTGFAVNLTTVFVAVAQTIAGIISIDMPQPLVAASYLNPPRYAIRAMAPFSLRSIRFTCDDSQRLPSGECVISTGEEVLDLYKLSGEGPWSVAALVGVIVVYRLVAWATLMAFRSRWTGVSIGRKGRFVQLIYKACFFLKKA